MTKARDKQKQMWVGSDFKDILEELKAKRVLVGKPVKSLAELTNKMSKCPSFKKVMDELMPKGKNKDLLLNLKIDKKRLFP